MEGGEDLQAARSAANQVAARAENKGRAAWFLGHARVHFVCECSDADCDIGISLTLPEWQAIRADPAQFVTAPEHVYTDLEEVIARTDEYWINMKTGILREIAIEADRK